MATSGVVLKIVQNDQDNNKSNNFYAYEIQLFKAYILSYLYLNGVVYTCKYFQMSKVIIFSRSYPSYHPRKGEPTYFVEKIFTGLDIFPNHVKDFPDGLELECFMMMEKEFKPKYHTIRAGHRFKVGDWFSPRVWYGKPYRSKQLIIAPDIQIKNIWNFEFIHGSPFSENDVMACVNGLISPICEISKNDGLSEDDFMDWFNKDFEGQIICWNENIKY